MEAIKYYYCKNCNLAIETKEGKCPQCRRNFRKVGVQSYTKEQVDEMIQLRLKELEADSTQEHADTLDTVAGDAGETDDGVMVCPACGKRYPSSVYECTCGMPLEPDYQEPVAITDQVVVGEVEDLFGEIIDNPVWKLKACRYATGQPEMAQKEIVLNRSIVSMGKSYIAKNHIFSANFDVDVASINKVSAYNALLIQQDGKLYIQYDKLIHNDHKSASSKKAPIYINGILLPEDQRRQLGSSDSILMGGGALRNMVRCIEFSVEKIPQPVVQNVTTGDVISVSDLKDMMTEIKEGIEGLGDKVDSTYETAKEVSVNVHAIQGGIEELKGIQNQRFDNVDNYMQTLKEFAVKFKSTDKKRSKDDYIKLYLKDNPNPEAFLACLNEAQLDYLSSAALLETAMEESGLEDGDYSGVFIFIGKLMENFLHDTVADFIAKYYKKDWRNDIKGPNGQPKDTLEIGNYTYTLNKHKDEIYNGIADDVNRIKKNRKLNFYKVKKVFSLFYDVKDIRNESAHSSLEALLRNEIHKVNKDAYYAAKEYMINNSFLVEIVDYHKTIFGKKK